MADNAFDTGSVLGPPRADWQGLDLAALAARTYRNGVPVAEGRSDALLHQHSADGAQHMEYVRDHGWFADLPLPEILTALRSHYGDLVGAEAPTDEFQAPGSPQPSGSRRP